MRTINIGDNSYELKYGLKFLREADKKYFDTRNGEKIGLGLPMVMGYLSEYDPLVIPEIVECGLSYLDVKPSKAQIETACENVMDERGVQAVCDDFLELFRAHKLHGPRAERVWKSIQQSQTDTKTS